MIRKADLVRLTTKEVSRPIDHARPPLQFPSATICSQQSRFRKSEKERCEMQPVRVVPLSTDRLWIKTKPLRKRSISHACDLMGRWKRLFVSINISELNCTLSFPDMDS